VLAEIVNDVLSKRMHNKRQFIIFTGLISCCLLLLLLHNILSDSTDVNTNAILTGNDDGTILYPSDYSKISQLAESWQTQHSDTGQLVGENRYCVDIKALVNISSLSDVFRDWHQHTEHLCNGLMTVFQHDFAVVKGVIIDNAFCL